MTQDNNTATTKVINKAEAQARLGQVKKAQKTLSNAAAGADPLTADIEHGKLLGKTGQFEKAMAKLNSTFVEAHGCIGKCNQQQTNWDVAKAKVHHCLPS